MQHPFTALRRIASALALAAAVVAALWGVPSTAGADARTDARIHFRNGMELIAQGNVDAGVAELEVAYEILPHPHVIYNIARAYGEAGRYEEALEYFERYLEGEPPDREEVRGFVRALEARLAEQRAASAAASTATPEEPAAQAQPAAPEAPTALATDDEILALEESATQIEALGEATDSDLLRHRAHSLRALAHQLRAGRAAAEAEAQAAAESGTTEGTETATTEGTEQPAETATTEGTEQPAETATTEGTEQPAETATTESPQEPTPETGGATALALGQEQQDLYDETVVSASRFAQNPLDAPNAIANVTRQDIRLSGLVNPGELVRRTPGAHVMSTGPSDVQIGIRGFNQRFSPRVLTLINGRSIYVDTLGTNFYWSQPYSVEDIERIEVIRGPASALYGANAFSGVINIITREPGADPGTEARIGVGNLRQVHGQVGHSGRAGGFAYRLSAGYDQSMRYTREITPDTVGRRYAIEDTDYDIRVARANGHLRYTFKPDLYADVQLGYADGFQVFQSTGMLREFQFNQTSANAMGTLQTPWGYVRAFWNSFVGDSGQSGAHNLLNHFESDTFDVEATFARRFHFLVDHNLYIGAAYRLKTIEWDFLDSGHSENHYNGFFQDTMRIGESVILVGSVRVDRHPLLDKLQVSPRGAIVVQPTEGQALRLSVGRAFRTQTFLESYLALPQATPLTAVSADALGAEINRRLDIGDLRPEDIVSSEVGYRFAGSSFFDVDASAYYNIVRNIVILDDVDPYTLAERASGLGAFDDENARFSVGTTGFTNDPTVFHVVGGELSARVYPIRGLDVYANYAYNHALLRNATRGTSDVGPAHLLNAGVQYRSPFGLDLSTDVHFASAQTWEERDFELTASGADAVFRQYEAPAYYLLNARVGYRLLDDDLEIGLSGYNVTNNKHRQHPFGQEIGMRLLGTVAFRF